MINKFVRVENGRAIFLREEICSGSQPFRRIGEAVMPADWNDSAFLLFNWKFDLGSSESVELEYRFRQSGRRWGRFPLRLRFVMIAPPKGQGWKFDHLSLQFRRPRGKKIVFRRRAKTRRIAPSGRTICDSDKAFR